MGMQVNPQRRSRPVPLARNEPEFFYPGELVHALGLEKIDYRQLRELLALVRGNNEAELDAGWAKYSLAEVAGMRLALELCGAYGVDLGRRRYLRVAPLKAACASLRSLGIVNPLPEVPMVRHRKWIVAQVQGFLVDPSSGQMILGEARDLLLDAIAGLPGEKAARARLRNQFLDAKSSVKARAQLGPGTYEVAGEFRT